MSNRHFWTETMVSDNNRPLNSKSKQIVYSVSSCFLKIKKKPFVIRTWKGQLSHGCYYNYRCSVVSDVRSLKEVDCYSRRGRRESHIITLSPSTRQQSDITRFYNARKHLSTLNTLNSALVGDLSFPGSVETLRKRFGLLVYCWK